ncbi:TRAP transporter small permease [Thalassobacillus sp. CUG 92003]|uniref:TRAP transporter small permease n=1 Tax=Thalassobacillus sp. CUG 92003 TaxID=2736641 RepID=UPI0015E6ED0B|nr:TRAP transporter small permease [Thalassobacillus sp. CUG 92003]
MKLVTIMSRILAILTVLSFAALVIVVSIQIAGRYTSLSFVWTEELSRFLFIFSIAFAAPLAMERFEFVRIEFLVNALPESAQKFYDAAIYLGLGVFSGAMVYYAYEFSLVGQMQTSATLAVSMKHVYMSMVIILSFLALYSLINVYAILAGKVTKAGEES